MAGEHRKRKRAYLEDYHKNEEGSYEYRGKLVVCEGLEGQWQKKKRRLWMLFIPLMIFAVIAGCIPAKGLTGTFYVVLPYACAVVGAITVGWALCRMSCAGDVMKMYIYEATVKKIPHRAMVTVIMNIAAVIGEIIYIVSGGNLQDTGCYILFALCCLAAGGLSAVLYAEISKTRWKELPPKKKNRSLPKKEANGE